MILKIIYFIEDVFMFFCLNLCGFRDGKEVGRGSMKIKKESRGGKRKEIRRERWGDGVERKS